MEEWKEYELGELITLNSGGTPDKSNKSYWGGDIPWISAKFMYDDYLYSSELKISQEGLDNGSRLAPKGSILLLTRGSGLFNRIPVCYVMRDLAYNQDVKCLESKNKELISTKFLFYWLMGNKNSIGAILETTGIGAGKIDTNRLKNIRISLPPKEYQQALIGFAESIMHKIELNRRINDNLPSFNYFETHISTIEKTVETNPALCIETCKSLVESICKTILANQNIEHDNYGQFQALVKQTINCLIDANECYKDDLCELARRIASVSQKLAEIRNISGFASHGQDINHISMSTTMSLLAYKITDVLGGFIIHYYINHASKRDSRIHYEDCQEFNELFDEENPLELGGVILSASEALYKQDYQAYKEIYFSYLDNLAKERKYVIYRR